MSLAELYDYMEQADAEVEYEEKVASEEEYGVEKLAHEYDAAGRIMARGFMDEFMKIAEAIEGE